MQKKLHIRKGDTVMIVAGDSRGQQGKVLRVEPDRAADHGGGNLVRGLVLSGG